MMNFKEEKLLVIAPHADDEVLGCCGLINKIKENGGEVYVQVLTIGGYSKIEGVKVTKEAWRKEFLNVIKFLEIDGYDIAFYENKIRYLDTVSQKDLIDILESKSKVSLKKIKPTIIAIPTVFSSHQDHTHTYKAAITSLRPHPQNSVHVPKLVISYESSEYNHWSSYSEFGQFSPNFYLKMSKTELKKKIAALNMYKSQLRAGHRDGNKMSALSEIRGNEIGVSFAEAFHIHRFHV